METYIVGVECIDGFDMFAFQDGADALNFIMDVEDHVIILFLAVSDEADLDV